MGAAFGSALYRRLPPNAAAPGAARLAVNALGGRMDAGTLQSGQLLVSELVTNSVAHGPEGGSAIELRASIQDARLRVEVADEGHGIDPAQAQRDPDPLRHWGLFLVDQLADRWGSERTPKAVVWFEIDAAAGAER
jgi:anti-sigma regulatory factor (Ser/Thr protein kinase)